MKQTIVFLSVFFFIFPFAVQAQSLKENIHSFLMVSTEAEKGKIIKSILTEKPSADTLIALLKNSEFGKPEKIGLVRAENLCVDGKIRPFYWYVPTTYNPANKTPLIVYLHGAVSRPNIQESIAENNIKGSPFIRKNIYVEKADKEGWILLFPLGQNGATWWDSVGSNNVLSQIRITKSRFNIDDNRIYMSGFSDGASASFFFAMTNPTDFAAFIPLNGHPASGAKYGGKQNYLVNLFNRPLHVVNTGLDELFPDKKIRPMMQLAQKAGATIMYRTYDSIGHVLSYGNKEFPKIADFISTHSRIIHPTTIKWETAHNELGRCMWLSIDKINPTGHASWYDDYNMDITDDNVSLGIVPDSSYKETAVRIDKIMDKSFSEAIGLKQGDIIIQLEIDTIKTMQNIRTYLNKKKAGDSTVVSILREGKQYILQGKFPEPKIMKLFKHDLPSARVEATFIGNTFYIRGSQLGAFNIYLHPDMIQFEQKVVIYVNDKKVFDKKVNPDAEFILRNFLEHKDRELIYVNKISIDVAK